jgi:hypothetical protein
MGGPFSRSGNHHPTYRSYRRRKPWGNQAVGASMIQRPSPLASLERYPPTGFSAMCFSNVWTTMPASVKLPAAFGELVSTTSSMSSGK